MQSHSGGRSVLSHGRNNLWLSEVNLDPDTLDDVVSIMVNKLAYKAFVKDIMDKYYKKNSANKKDVFNSPDNPEHSDQDSDTGGWSRLRTSWGVNEEEWVVCERNQSVIY